MAPETFFLFFFVVVKDESHSHCWCHLNSQQSFHCRFEELFTSELLKVLYSLVETLLPLLFFQKYFGSISQQWLTFESNRLCWVWSIYSFLLKTDNLKMQMSKYVNYFSLYLDIFILGDFTRCIVVQICSGKEEIYDPS